MTENDFDKNAQNMALEDWINEMNTRYKDDEDSINWIQIAKEILHRKTLFFATKKDLEDHNISDYSFEIAATDVFVEKAQKILTSRAKIFFRIGTYIASATILLLAISVAVLLKFMPVDTSVTSGYVFTLYILRNVTITTIFLAIAYVLISIARALFHEGLVLYNRRHALRFGRLYVYLKRDKINFKELEEAFKWNTEFSTAFRDINAEAITKTILGKVIDTIPELMKSYTGNNDSEKSNTIIKK